MKLHKGCIITMIISLSVVVGSAMSMDSVGLTVTNGTMMFLGGVFAFVSGFLSLLFGLEY